MMKPDVENALQAVSVFTMGKVGSSSVTDALASAGLETLQVHVLQCNARERAARRPNVRHLQSSVEVLDIIENEEPIRFVHLVRDPISRNVSAFFQNFERLVGGDVDDYTVDQITNLICEKVLPEEPQEWLDTEFSPFTGVDLGKHRMFDGAAIATEAKWPLLLLRSDFDDVVKSNALNDFLGREDIIVARSKNVTSGKVGGSMSSQIKSAGMPSSYVDECLAQPFVSTTWSPSEIEALRSRWTASQSEASLSR